MDKSSKKIVRRKKRRLLRLVSAVLIILSVLFGISIFFKIDEITVGGNSRYSNEAIIAATGLEVGDNLYWFNKNRIIDKLLAEFSYIDGVLIRRGVPDTVMITITESEPLAYIRSAGSYWLVNAELKLLEKVSSPGEAMEIVGLELLEPEAGSQVAVAEEDSLKLSQLRQLLRALSGYAFFVQVNQVDVSIVSSPSFRYDNRLTVNIGDTSDIDYKMKYFNVILGEIGLDEAGTVLFTETGVARFIKE